MYKRPEGLHFPKSSYGVQDPVCQAVLYPMAFLLTELTALEEAKEEPAYRAFLPGGHNALGVTP